MAVSYMRPFLAYNNHTSHFYPGVARDQYREWREVDRRDHIAGGGAMFSYGGNRTRRFLEVTFVRQNSGDLIAAPADWVTFYEAVRDGSEFVYHDDDSCLKFSSSVTCGSSVTFGDIPRGGASDRRLRVKLDQMQFEPVEDEVHDYWNITLRMRVVE